MITKKIFHRENRDVLYARDIIPANGFGFFGYLHFNIDLDVDLLIHLVVDDLHDLHFCFLFSLQGGILDRHVHDHFPSEDHYVRDGIALYKVPAFPGSGNMFQRPVNILFIKSHCFA